MTNRVQKIIVLLMYACTLGACRNEKVPAVLDLFAEPYPLFQKVGDYINEDSLASVEGLVCDGENMIVYDYHSGSSYTLFDKSTGDYIARFGTIGQGPTEILLGSYGYLSDRCFSVFNDQTRIVMKYSLDSLRCGKLNGSPVYLTKYDIPDIQISRLIALDDSTFVGAGTYKSRYQYFLFNTKNHVLDCGVDVYNASDSTFNTYTKFLSNQGDLVMHPEKKLFASSVNFSSNIDFFTIENNKIRLIQSLRLGNPISESVTGSLGGEVYYSVNCTEHSVIGYINLSATSRHVYALYSDKKAHESNRSSNVVLVFDWKGNPVRRYELDADAYYIAVDEEQQNMLAAIKNGEDGWSIACYPLKFSIYSITPD